VHYWAVLQSMHGLRCYGNIARNAKCQRVLVASACTRSLPGYYLFIIVIIICQSVTTNVSSLHLGIDSRCRLH